MSHSCTYCPQTPGPKTKRPASKSGLNAPVYVGVLGCHTPACHRSREKPTAALNSSVSTSLMSLPVESSFQLLGTRQIAEYALFGVSAKNDVWPAAIPHWLSLG